MAVENRRTPEPAGTKGRERAKARSWRFLLAVIFGATSATSSAADLLHHRLRVTLVPQEHRLQVDDEVTLPDDWPASKPVHFLLHGGLTASASASGVSLRLLRETPRADHFDSSSRKLAMPDGVPVQLYRVTVPSGKRSFSVRYSGQINHQPQTQGEEQARGFDESPGIIGPEGVFLAGSSAWYPWLGDGLVRFTLEVQVPDGWEAVSQGERVRRTSDPSGIHVIWDSPQPQQEIFLVAAPFTEYARDAGPTRSMVFLRKPDRALADKYLDATAQYLRLYSDMLGPYPYGKFALVENFWETGYGMPSFTLLGSRIIRFPFILRSSYPHEILHNWWGNGVYVKGEGGNWSEGLTAYLADHLFQEQQGAGASYRESVLQKYLDYASRSKDFPLTAFGSRVSPATEAVGYGKALMAFHMLRRELGDRVFLEGLRRFYVASRFRLAGFDELFTAWEAASGRSLHREYLQWVTQPGAPQLKLAAAQARDGEQGWRLSFALEQVQAGTPYRLSVPLAVTLQGQPTAALHVAHMDGKRLEMELPLPARPLRLDVDPEFDLFRLLDPRELPPALSNAFGAERTLLVLPSAAPPALLAAYRAYAEDWQRKHPGTEVRLDSDLGRLPAGPAIWLLGWENSHRTTAASAFSGAVIDEQGVRVGETRIPRAGHAAVLTGSLPPGGQSVTWLAASDPAALPGLARKLPHYDRYGYLGFAGAEPANTAKGRWQPTASPLTAYLTEAGVERGRLAERRALAPAVP